ncbi:hypothetical protein HBI64_004370 [Parastagonospora nodorum]|nr:hypothetical protein HBH68_014070 [Parastagonospora nodorum]KAH6145688.1 hypothetical protein HBI64_004370 [Parastagonospora nodorum]KAH6437090.1 hypothetical protein HBI14_014180 [Parastagonospora nodorum]
MYASTSRDSATDSNLEVHVPLWFRDEIENFIFHVPGVHSCNKHLDYLAVQKVPKPHLSIVRIECGSPVRAQAQGCQKRA